MIETNEKWQWRWMKDDDRNEQKITVEIDKRNGRKITIEMDERW